MLNYSAIPVIVVICYIAITAIKSTKINSKWYPLISCVLGAILAAAMFFVVPEFIGAASLTAAVISGAISGLAATGTNQVFKQLIKAAENGEDLSQVITKPATIPQGTPQANTSEAQTSTTDKSSDDTGGNP